MSFHNETNRKRVQKIMETLHLISKSGASNGIDREDMQSMLEPLIQAMAELSPAVGYPDEAEPGKGSQEASQGSSQSFSQAPETSAQPIHNYGLTKPPHIVIREAAQEADLKDLTWALAVFMSRIDELLHE